MKTLLLLSVGYCLCVCLTADTHTGTHTHTDRDGEKVIPEENSVLQLTKGNFNRALRRHKQLLVHFYAPLSGDALRVAEELRHAAVELQGSEVRLGVVDVSKEKDLAKELNATALPPLRLYLSGDKHNPVPCPAIQDSASIVRWLKRRAVPSADVTIQLGQLEDFKATEEMVVLGLFKDLEQGLVQVFYEASVDVPDLPFAVTRDPAVYNKYDLTHDSVLLLRQSKGVQVYEMTSETSKEEVFTFIRVHQMDLVTEFNGQTSSQILSSTVFNHAILFAQKSAGDFEDIYTAFESAAASYRGKLLFVLIDVEEPRNGRMLEYFRVREVEAPLVRVVNMTDHVQYQLHSDTLDVPTITHFCQTYLDGKAKPKLQSEPVPEGWDKQPVKELVGQNLERVAFNPDKTVFVMLYLPYSERSRSLFKLWEDLAQAFLHREEIVIARIDASANDINLSMHEPYPSLRLFPALRNERVLAFSGKKTVKELVRFVEREMEKAKKDRVKEDEERKKYIEAQKAAEAKEAKEAQEAKDEL